MTAHHNASLRMADQREANTRNYCMQLVFLFCSKFKEGFLFCHEPQVEYLKVDS